MTDIDATIETSTEATLRSYLRKSTQELTSLRAQIQDAERRAVEPIAILGMACRYPGGVQGPADLWNLVDTGRDATTALPDDRGWDLSALTGTGGDPQLTYSTRGGFIDGIADFDARFFGINPREALAMDPKQRLLLEVTWESIERAGIDPKALAGTDTAVYTGLYHDNYGVRPDTDRDGIAGYMITGNTLSVASGRIAYVLGLEGPAISLDTACSSSLTALHLAVRALRSRECSLALVTAATVMTSPSAFVGFSQLNALAADGRCKAFSDNADGFAAAEGVGALVVARQSDAQANDWPILALVRGSAVNQDGASNGLTAPRASAQRRVIADALRDAGLTAADVDAVEAHGTGTTLGDVIEVEALLGTYGRDHSPERPLHLGTVKSNIGHTQSAAGIAGVIKMVQALRHERLPCTLHAKTPNRQIDWEAGTVRLLSEPQPWPAGAGPRRAGVSSFGISGTNAHMILEEAPRDDFPIPEQASPHHTALAWPLSAKSPSALTATAGRLLAHVGGDDSLAPVDIADALARRTLFDYRAVITGRHRDEMMTGLRALADGRPHPSVSAGRARSGRTAFVFPGQGSQWAGMARQLFDESNTFRSTLADCAAAFGEFVDWDLLELVTDPAAPSSTERPEVVQPLLFAVMVALAETWRGFGVTPAGVIGHSQGEVAAAYTAGALSLRDAARVVTARSSLLTTLSGTGGMASVPLPAEAVQATLASGHGALSIAAINGPCITVVSGPGAALGDLLDHYKRDGVDARRIPVDYASHSPAVEAISPDIERALSGLSATDTDCDIFSTVLARPAAGSELTARYWAENLCKPVLFLPAVRAALADGYQHFIEISPHPVLAASIGEVCAEQEESSTCYIGATLKRDQGDALQLSTSVAAAHAAGVDADFGSGRTGTRVLDLPTYAFDRERFWLQHKDIGVDAATLGLDAVDHALLGAVLTQEDDTRRFTGRIDLQSQPWLADHIVLDAVVVPGAALVECVARVGDDLGYGAIEELVMMAPLTLTEDTAVAVQVVIGSPADERRRVSILSRPLDAPDAEWRRHAEGALRPSAPPNDPVRTAWPPSDAVSQHTDDLYQRFAAQGYHYGPSFQCVRRVWRGGSDWFAEIDAPAAQRDWPRFRLHPGLLDGALQTIAHALTAERSGASGMWLPYEWRGVHVRPGADGPLRAHIAATDERRFAITLTDSSGRQVADIDSLTLRELDPGTVQPAGTREALFVAQWTAVPADAPHVEWVDITDDGQASDAAVAVLRCADDDATHDDSAVPDEVHRRLATVLDTVQTWLANTDSSATLVVATRDAVGADPGDAISGLRNSGIWGLLRSAQNENLNRLVLVDVDDWSALPHAVDVVLNAGEPQLAVRRGACYTLRLAHYSDTQRITGASLFTTDAPAEDWRLTPVATGTFTGDNLIASPHPAQPLGPNEVRIRVHAVGVNFRDLMITLGTYPEDETPLGTEGIGTVLEIGDAVDSVHVGDQVMGAFQGIGPAAVTDHRVLAPLPRGWSPIQAAGSVQAYLTAYYALCKLADLQPGQRVLVHAGTGGTGMALIAVAKWIGAEIFATASPAKWPALRRLGLADTHIANSRDLTFADAFAAVGDGCGIDVVVNSLTGAAIDSSLSLMKRGGTFIELGRTEARDPARVEADHGVAYRPFVLPELSPDRFSALFDEVMALLRDNQLEPIPAAAFDVRRAPQVFRYMSQARHVGKLVLTLSDRLRADGTVLITGGTGTLGRTIAEHLVTHCGARRLLLLSRRGSAAEGAADLLSRLRSAGAHADVIACDAADRSALAKVLDMIPSEHALTAVVHTAGALDDGTFAEMTAERLSTTLRPKVNAAWNLHQLTTGMPLAAFVMFSSAAGQLGSPGQANYAAANTFCDALAQYRQHRGLPATSLAWGLWQDTTGLTGHLTDADRKRMARSGLGSLSTAEGLDLFHAAVESGQPLLTPMRVVPETMSEPELVPAVLRHLARQHLARQQPAAPTASHSTSDRLSLAEELRGRTQKERERIVLDVIRADAAAVLGHSDAADVDPESAFREAGFDSLSAVEFKNRLLASTGVSLAVSAVFDYPTPRKLAKYLAAEVTAEPAASSDEPGATVDDLLLTLEQLRGIVAESDDATRREVSVALKMLEHEIATHDKVQHNGHRTNEHDDQDLRVADDDVLFGIVDQR